MKHKEYQEKLDRFGLKLFYWQPQLDWIFNIYDADDNCLTPYGINSNQFQVLLGRLQNGETTGFSDLDTYLENCPEWFEKHVEHEEVDPIDRQIEIILNGSLNELPGHINGIYDVDLMKMARVLDARVVMLARVSSYIEAIASNRSHDQAVKDQNKVANKVRDALGYVDTPKITF